MSGNINTQKGASSSNAQIDLIEDYSNYEAVNNLHLSNAQGGGNQYELGGTQKLANLSRYLAED